MQQPHPEPTDVLLVGAGPIGIELAVALKRHGLRYVHVDAQQIGHTIAWFAPQTRFFSSPSRIAIAGVPLQTPNQDKATREEYLAYLRAVVQQFDLPIRTHEPVTHIRPQPDGSFLVTTHPNTGPHTYHARHLILATGGTARPRLLDIPGESLPHVSHYFQDPHTYFRKRLLIVGGKNSAVEAALRCHHAGAHVAFSYRRPALDAESIKYWLYPEIKGLLDARKIDPHFDTVPIAITPAHTTLQRPDGSTDDVPADFVLLLIGYEADMSLCKLAGVQLQQPGNVPTYDPRTMQTNVPNLYLAGTVVGGTQSKYRVFIENCHVHTDRILASLTNQPPPDTTVAYAQPES